MDKLLGSAKALVAAVVGFAATYISVKFGLNIPEDAQVWVAALITSAITGAVTWLVPNKEA